MAAYRQVYDSRHLQADCQEPGSAPEHYARQSSMGYTLLLLKEMHTKENGSFFCLTVYTSSRHVRSQFAHQSIGLHPITFYSATLCYSAVYDPMSVCVRLSLPQVGVLSKQLNESGWFLAWELPSTCPTLCCKEILVYVV